MPPVATILLVEDDELVRGLVRKVLERDGYAVLEAGSGQEALLLGDLYAGPIDLVLTDVTMPGMSGYEVAARLSARRPAVRVLYMSGYVAEALAREERLRAPLLEKPFTPAALGHAVRELLADPRAA